LVIRLLDVLGRNRRGTGRTANDRYADRVLQTVNW